MVFLLPRFHKKMQKVGLIYCQIVKASLYSATKYMRARAILPPLAGWRMRAELFCDYSPDRIGLASGRSGDWNKRSSTGHALDDVQVSYS